jgi:hypothetical protein
MQLPFRIYKDVSMQLRIDQLVAPQLITYLKIIKHLTTVNQVSEGMQTLKSSIQYYSSTTPLLNSQHKHEQTFLRVALFYLFREYMILVPSRRS